MKPNPEFSHLATNEELNQTITSLKSKGVKVIVAENGAEAKNHILAILPENAEVFSMNSKTLEGINVLPEINESGRYNAVRKKFSAMDRSTQKGEMRKLGAGPDWTIGSVHAVTQEGQFLIASNTGSQLPAYAYGAGNVIWVIGIQKIVKDMSAGMKRLYEYSLPLENERAKKAYGTGSAVNKILIINNEVQKGRITAIFIKQNIGF